MIHDETRSPIYSVDILDRRSAFAFMNGQMHTVRLPTIIACCDRLKSTDLGKESKSAPSLKCVLTLRFRTFQLTISNSRVLACDFHDSQSFRGRLSSNFKGICLTKRKESSWTGKKTLFKRFSAPVGLSDFVLLAIEVWRKVHTIALCDKSITNCVIHNCDLQL